MNRPLFYLASKSPRRSEILHQLNYPFVVLPSSKILTAFDGDEIQHAGESGAEYVVRTAKEKAFLAKHTIEENQWELLPILSADTVVLLHSAVLGKPVDRIEAVNFLRAMSGLEHEVRTAVTLLLPDGTLNYKVSVSRVCFRELTQSEIESYVDSGEPFDKAGGYGIQGKAGAFIESIEGSYTGIMGLPVFETSALLSAAGINLF